MHPTNSDSSGPGRFVKKTFVLFALAGLSSAGMGLDARQQHQAEALGKLVYNYERSTNRGLVRSASNLAQQLPVDSQEILDLVSSAATDSGSIDFEGTLLAMASAASSSGLGNDLSELALLLNPGLPPAPIPDPLPDLDWDLIVLALQGQCVPYLDPAGLPECLSIGFDPVMESGQVTGYEVYFAQPLLSGTARLITFLLDINGNVTEVIVSS